MALDPKIAFFGNQFRKESFFVILTYYLLILNWKNYQEEKDIKNLIKIIIVIATINCLYGILQQYTNLTFKLKIKSSVSRTISANLFLYKEEHTACPIRTMKVRID